MSAEAAHRLPNQDEPESVPSHSPDLGFRRGAEVEERIDVLPGNSGTGIGDGDDELPVSGDEVRPHVLLIRVRDRVEGIVEEVSGNGDEVAGVESFGREFAGGGDGEFDAALIGLRGLADHERGDEWFVE